MDNQVLTIEQVLELKKLGFNVNKYAHVVWSECTEECQIVKTCTEKEAILYINKGQCCVYSKITPTLTVGDIIILLQHNFIVNIDTYGTSARVQLDTTAINFTTGYMPSLLEALIKAIKWCIKNNYIAK